MGTPWELGTPNDTLVRVKLEEVERDIGPNTIAVLIVDDQAPFRGAARTVISLASGFEVVGEAESGEDAVTMAADLRPGLVLMDINMPGIDGIEATRRITTARPDVTVILLSTYDAHDLPDDARACGAAAYVHKEDFSPAVVRQIWDGEHQG